MSDNSMATQIEDWIVARLRAIQYSSGAPPIMGPLFPDPFDVEPWEGNDSGTEEAAAEELSQANRPRIARVTYLEDEAEDLEAGFIQRNGRYLVAVGIRSERSKGEGRRGDDDEIGTNLVRDLIFYALHRQNPGVTDGVSTTDKCTYVGSTPAFKKRNLWVLRMVFNVVEVPSGN